MDDRGGIVIRVVLFIHGNCKLHRSGRIRRRLAEEDGNAPAEFPSQKMNVDICARSGPCAFPTGRPFQFDGIFSELVLGQMDRFLYSITRLRFRNFQSVQQNLVSNCKQILYNLSRRIVGFDVDFFKGFIEQRKRDICIFSSIFIGLIIILFVLILSSVY